jgi:hypothetical protein
MTIFSHLFSPEIKRQVRAALRVIENDLTFVRSSSGATPSTQDRDRYPYDRLEVMTQALEAWRVNPLARRIIELTSQYVVGGGLSFECKNQYVSKFLTKFWEHRLNRMVIRVTEWCDELSRTGNLFILLSTDQAGMSYVRSIPATQVRDIQARANDIEQPVSIVVEERDETPGAFGGNLTEHTYPVYDDLTDDLTQNGSFDTVIFHYAINRPTGGQWGESDLAPQLRWLARYANWLEDRARLNRYRTAFLYNVKAKFTSEADRLARQAQLNSAPPTPGSILVTDENETWSVIQPTLASSDANEDGLALKKMIAAGTGLPLHFLAEPESATRTTAEAAGGPTFRRFEQRQRYFMWLINDVLQVVIRRRAMVDRHMPANPNFELTGADISARDNISLAMAASNLVNSLMILRDRQMMDDSEFLRLTYRFLGEAVDVDAMLARGKEAGPSLVPQASRQPADLVTKPDQAKPDQSKPNPAKSLPNNQLVDPTTGELKDPGAQAENQ